MTSSCILQHTRRFLSYNMVDGRASLIPPIEDAKVALDLRRGQACCKVARSARREARFRVHPGAGKQPRARYFCRDNGTIKALLPGRWNLAAGIVAQAVAYRYPKERVVTKGMKWTIPAEASPIDIDLLCEVAGFSEVAGRETVAFKSEGQLSNHEYQQSIAKQLQVARKNEEKQGSALHLRKYLEKRMELVIKQRWSRAFRGTWYVDMRNGLTLRRELAATTRIRERASFRQHRDEGQPSPENLARLG